MQGDGSIHLELLHCSCKCFNARLIAGVYSVELIVGLRHLNEVYSAGSMPGD